MANGPPAVPRISLEVIAPASLSVPVANCDGCGVCCLEQNIPPYLDEIDFIPIALQKEVIEARKREAELEGQPCIWFDLTTRKCRHHEDRPNICREYEVGGDLCLETRERAGAGRRVQSAE